MEEIKKATVNKDSQTGVTNPGDTMNDLNSDGSKLEPGSLTIEKATINNGSSVGISGPGEIAANLNS